MTFELPMLIGGILLLLASGEVTIKAAQILAHKLNISETFIGLTIISVGTSLAELATHITVSRQVLLGNDLSGLAAEQRSNT